MTVVSQLSVARSFHSDRGGSSLSRVLALALAGASVLVFALPAVSAAQQSRKARLDLQLERTPVIVRESYTQLPPIGERGQMGVNFGVKGCAFSLSHQSGGDLYVRAGIIDDKPSLIEDGLRAFRYAFRRQRVDGSLPANQTETYAFFVEAVAHSILLLRASPYGDDYRATLKRFERRLERAAPHMIEPAAWSEFKQRNASYTHSAYVVGTGLSMTGQVTNRSRFKRYGREAVRLGVRRQRDNGVNPELGGYDVRYQMAGLVYAQRFRVFFPGHHLRERLERVVRRGLRWMSTRVDSDGWIDFRGSTRACTQRSGFCGEVREPQPKSPGYRYAIRGFAYWGALSDDGGLLARARAMQRYERGADDLCGPKEETLTASGEPTHNKKPAGSDRVLSRSEGLDLLE